MISFGNRVWLVMFCTLTFLAVLSRTSQAQRVVPISVKVDIVAPFAPNPVAANVLTIGVVALTSDDPNVRQEMANATDPWINPPATWSWHATRNGNGDDAHATISSAVDPGVDPFQATVTAKFALGGSWVVSANGAVSFSIPHSSDIFQGSATNNFPAVTVAGYGPGYVAEYEPADATVYPILDSIFFNTWHGSMSYFHLKIYDNQATPGAYADGQPQEEFGYFWCIFKDTKDPNGGAGPSTWPKGATFVDFNRCYIITNSTDPPSGWINTGGVHTGLQTLYQRWHVVTDAGNFTLNTHLVQISYGLPVSRSDAEYRKP